MSQSPETVKVTKSPTMWTFAAIAAASAITELLASPDFKLALGSYATIITFLLGMAGMWLRKYTTKPLEPIIKKKDPEDKTPHDKNLDILNEPSQSDDMYVMKEIP